VPEKEKKRKKQNYAGSGNHSPHELRKRSQIDTGYLKTPPQKKKISMGVRRVAGLT
jgi:hypothetical protein